MVNRVAAVASSLLFDPVGATPERPWPGARPRILIVEDERKVAEALREGLEDERFEVVTERSGDGALVRAAAETFDVILLDMGLPGRDGREVLATLRQQRIDTPVLVLTARDSLRDRVDGLNMGADDYLVKPFAFEEVLARIRARLRREPPASAALLTIADLRMDLASRRVTRAGRLIELTLREFQLLGYLLSRRGHVVSRGTLARDVWNEPVRGTPLDNVIDVHIGRIRRKVDTAAAVKLIHTVRGVGFIVRDDVPPSPESD